MSDLVEKIMDLLLGVFVRFRVGHVAMEQERNSAVNPHTGGATTIRAYIETTGS